VLARGGTCTWESWDAPETGKSLSHGWGADVLVAIQRHVLGVTATRPGGARFAIRPAWSAMPAAAGTVPTQRGAVAVEWERAGGGVRLRVAVPAGAEALLRLPDGPRRLGRGTSEFLITSI